VATHIFSVDRDHPLVIARLVIGGRLAFPDHTELVEILFETVADLKEGTVDQDYELFASALTQLSSDATVPGHVQMRARVEQMKLAVPGHDARPSATVTKRDDTSSGRAASPKSQSVLNKRRGRPIIGEIDDLNLTLE
jgi:hypothetical protein